MDTSVRKHPSLPRPIQGEMKLENSNRLLAEARRLVPGVTQTMMKRPEMFAPGSFPVFIAQGHGALVEDVDGQQYIDYICGLGATRSATTTPPWWTPSASTWRRGSSTRCPRPSRSAPPRR